MILLLVVLSIRCFGRNVYTALLDDSSPVFGEDHILGFG
jgi:hypothetical protein